MHPNLLHVSLMLPLYSLLLILGPQICHLITQGSQQLENTMWFFSNYQIMCTKDTITAYFSLTSSLTITTSLTNWATEIWIKDSKMRHGSKTGWGMKMRVKVEVGLRNRLCQDAKKNCIYILNWNGQTYDKKTNKNKH